MRQQGAGVSPSVGIVMTFNSEDRSQGHIDRNYFLKKKQDKVNASQMDGKECKQEIKIQVKWPGNAIE